MHGTVTSAHNRRNVTVVSSFGPKVVAQSSLHGCWYHGTRPFVVWQASAAVTTCITWGKRNINPECRPVPKPMEDRTPRMIHQAASLRYISTVHSAPPSVWPHTGGVNSSGASEVFSANQPTTSGTTSSQSRGLRSTAASCEPQKAVTWRRNSCEVVKGLVRRLIFSRSAANFSRRASAAFSFAFSLSSAFGFSSAFGLSSALGLSSAFGLSSALSLALAPFVLAIPRLRG
mmetsp:Transcript_89718/g.231605  ORF Transcript_89718/g.231605 Transcript_89718/m.231605 type:complete len:231 (-) Transcript_89718:49-741(-)